jgi:hypothetical protein
MTFAPIPASETRRIPQPQVVLLSSGFDANLILENSEKLRCITQKQKPGLHDRVSYVLLVPKRRLELLQAYAHQTLNLARLPVPPLRLYCYSCITSEECQ